MNWIVNNTDQIGQLLVAHLGLAFLPVILSFVISIPIGWLANRFRLSRGVILTICGLLYAIPSLPLLIVLPIFTGQGIRTSTNLIVGLTIYGIALMVRSTADGLASVDPDIKQSATAMGYSGTSQFWRVELPLAGPVLLAGIRVVSVSTVSLTTVGAVLGIQSLGLLFTDGLQRGIQAEVWTGIVLTIVVALVFDLVIVQIGRLLMPWTRVTKASRRVRKTIATEEVTA